LATFAHATSSTRPTDASRIQSARSTRPTMASFSVRAAERILRFFMNPATVASFG
jgi:hypothetical protein